MNKQYKKEIMNLIKYKKMLGGKKMYKIYFDAILCDRFTNRFLKKFDVMRSGDTGAEVQITMNMEEMPTQEQIQQMIKCMEASKDNIELSQYYACVRLNRIEVEVEE